MSVQFFKKLSLIAIFSVASMLLFAASGGKGKKKGSTTKTNTVATSSKISLGKISLTGKYEFKANKIQLQNKKDYTTVNNYTILKSGNKTMLVASKHTLVKPVIKLENTRTTVNVTLKLKLN